MVKMEKRNGYESITEVEGKILSNNGKTSDVVWGRVLGSEEST